MDALSVGIAHRVGGAEFAHPQWERRVQRRRQKRNGAANGTTVSPLRSYGGTSCHQQPSHGLAKQLRRRRLVRQVTAAAAPEAEADATSAVAGTAQVTFKVQHTVSFGQALRVVGDPAELGAWDAAAAPGMEWGEGDVWTAALEVPKAPVGFKFVVVGDDGSPLEWEAGDNRTLQVEPESGALVAKGVWNDTAKTTTMSAEDAALAEAEAIEVSEATTPEQEELAAAVAADVPQEEPAEVPAEAAFEGETPEDEPEQGALPEDFAPEATVDLADTETPAGVWPADTATVDLTGSSVNPRPAPAPAAAAQEEPSQAAEAVEEAVEEAADEAGKVAEAIASAASPVEASSVAPAASTTSPPSTTPEASSSADSGSGTHLAVALVGLAALPVVAWSEITLKATGCGLPPGPGGVLGALEGLSYLAVLGIVAWSVATRVSKGQGLPAGPGGLLGAVEGLSYVTVLAGWAVLGLQVKEYGYIPSALPDANCFGKAVASAQQLPDQNRRSSSFGASTSAPALAAFGLPPWATLTVSAQDAAASQPAPSQAATVSRDVARPTEQLQLAAAAVRVGAQEAARKLVAQIDTITVGAKLRDSASAVQKQVGQKLQGIQEVYKTGSGAASSSTASSNGGKGAPQGSKAVSTSSKPAAPKAPSDPVSKAVAAVKRFDAKPLKAEARFVAKELKDGFVGLAKTAKQTDLRKEVLSPLAKELQSASGQVAAGVRKSAAAASSELQRRMVNGAGEPAGKVASPGGAAVKAAAAAPGKVQAAAQKLPQKGGGGTLLPLPPRPQ